MNYSEPLISQVVIFCRAVGCGIILGVLYDAVSFTRMLFGEKKGVYVFFDTVYFLAASLISFFFMVLYNSGQVRFNLMLAELFGGAAFHLSLGKYILGRSYAHLTRIRKFLAFLAKPFVKSAVKLKKFSLKLFCARVKKPPAEKNKEKNRKKFSNIGKILLKNKNKSV